MISSEDNTYRSLEVMKASKSMKMTLSCENLNIY